MSKNISIIVITNDNDIVLRDTLPTVLGQQYDAKFEVIVVRETKKGDIKDILEPFYNQYENLHSTYLPDRPQYVTNEEIEILLGVKAAKYDNVVMISPAFSPESDEWLQQVGNVLEDTPLSDTRPIMLGDAHLKKIGFFKRYKHKREVRKIINKWCKPHGVRRKSLYLSKENTGLFSIAFLHDSYIIDMSLRNIIYKQIYI
ncbi:hypothetical protein E5358_02500 [Palleniella muris]|uniref:Uncharacterized protein n=1 Tax=Palleniella muris TaxID=3038145 RepID=A0AC61QSZ9_9BACT|nr:hypothetical protein [Palleniella muris]TGX83537.1 hypothetical protein E5358_02500 [Palleniella muris]